MPAGTTVFPTNLDSNEVLDGADEITSTRVNNAYVEIEAIEAKVGKNSSAVTTSHDYKLSRVTGVNKAAAYSEVLQNIFSDHEYQWQVGTTNISLSTEAIKQVTVTLPTPYTSTLFVAIVSVGATTTNPVSHYNVSTTPVNKSSFIAEVYHILGTGTSDTITISWFTIGF